MTLTIGFLLFPPPKPEHSGKPPPNEGGATNKRANQPALAPKPPQRYIAFRME
jgi:hypothetical protein